MRYCHDQCITTSPPVCRQAQLQQGHEEYQSVARREQREQERRRADQARDAERKTREEVRQRQSTAVPCHAVLKVHVIIQVVQSPH